MITVAPSRLPTPVPLGLTLKREVWYSCPDPATDTTVKVSLARGATPATGMAIGLLLTPRSGAITMLTSCVSKPLALPASDAPEFHTRVQLLPTNPPASVYAWFRMPTKQRL